MAGWVVLGFLVLELLVNLAPPAKNPPMTRLVVANHLAAEYSLMYIPSWVGKCCMGDWFSYRESDRKDSLSGWAAQPALSGGLYFWNRCSGVKLSAIR